MKKNTKKFTILFLMGVILTLNISACNNSHTPAFGRTSKIITYVPECHNGDAKFWNDKIITSVNGKLMLYDLEGNKFKTYDSINANWIAVCPRENVVIYSNFNNEVGIARFDKDYNLISDNTILKGNLSIDPTIIKRKDSFYITVTQIEGTVNNADPGIENGKYTILFYKSDDLLNWEYISTPISCMNNIEDVDLFCTDNIFYLVYEKEQLDKGLSSICLMESADEEGVKWKQPKELLPSDSDHEPAAIIRDEDNRYRLYYSCDRDNIGSSYMGAKIYYVSFDGDFNLLDKDNKIETATDRGILLYDVQQTEAGERYLFAKNYLTDCDMVVEEKAD